jgi:hypothetical protein
MENFNDGTTHNDNNNFNERPFEEVEGGYFDGKGFYCTPEGSFWDENQVYFNRYGKDKHGGSYDEYCIYVPGPGWDEDLGCYKDEIDENFEMNIDDDVKDLICNNLHDELVEGFECYERFYRNYDNDAIDDLDEELYNKDEAEIFQDYIQKNFENKLSNDNNIGTTNTISAFNNETSGFHSNFNDENQNKINLLNSGTGSGKHFISHSNSANKTNNITVLKFNDPERNTNNNVNFSNSKMNPFTPGYNY